MLHCPCHDTSAYYHPMRLLFHHCTTALTAVLWLLHPLCSQHSWQRLEILLALRRVTLGQLRQLVVEIDSSIRRCPKQTLGLRVFVIVQITHTNFVSFVWKSRWRRLLQGHQQRMLKIIKAVSVNDAILMRLPQFGDLGIDALIIGHRCCRAVALKRRLFGCFLY